jgi:hypothetical protein
LFLVNKYIKEYLREEHKEFLPLEGLDLGKNYVVIAKGQSLEKNRHFFQVETKDESRACTTAATASSSRVVEVEEEGRVEESALDQASRAYLQSLDNKEQALHKKLTPPHLTKKIP